MDSRETLHLLGAASSGNREALDQLFARELPRLRRLLALRAGPALTKRLDVDDLVQEAYAEALKQLETYSYQGRDSFFHWLAAIAVNRLQNLRRMEVADKRDAQREVRFGGRETVELQGAVATDTTPVKGPGPRTLTASAEGIQRLHAALAKLSETDREVVLLARFEGLPMQAIAVRLGRTRNAVALLLSRALRKLKDVLDDGAATKGSA